jgi:hypothetical protein
MSVGVQYLKSLSMFCNMISSNELGNFSEALSRVRKYAGTTDFLEKDAQAKAYVAAAAVVADLRGQVLHRMLPDRCAQEIDGLDIQLRQAYSDAIAARNPAGGQAA